jgi:hypothetical protein
MHCRNVHGSTFSADRPCPGEERAKSLAARSGGHEPRPCMVELCRGGVYPRPHRVTPLHADGDQARMSS